MRTFILVSSWLLWLVGALLTLTAFVIRSGHWTFVPEVPKRDMTSFNQLFWAALAMLVALGTCLYCIRHHLWFSSRRKTGIGFWLVTVLFYFVALWVPFAGFPPFFEGDRNVLQWASCAAGLVLLVLGFPKLPLDLEERPLENKQKSRAALVMAIVCGLIAVIAPFSLVIRAKPTERAERHYPEEQKTDAQTGLPATIVFSQPIPSSWKLMDQSTIKDENTNSCNRVVLRSLDQNRILLISVLGQRVSASDRLKFLKMWKPTLLKSLRADYGDLQEDNFFVGRVGDHDFAQFESHAATPTGTISLLNKSWFVGENFVSCQAFGNGVPVTNDTEIAEIIGRVGLKQ